MNKPIFTLLFVLVATVSFSQRLTKADYIEDLEFLKRTLPVRHTNLFAKTTKATFEKLVDDIADKADSLNYDMFTVELFKLMVSIKDEHTFVERQFNRILPIKLGMFKGGLYVTGIDSAFISVLGSKLVAINNHSFKQINALFKEAILSENQSYFNDHLLHFINNPAFLKGLGIIDSDKEAEFTFVGDNNKISKIKLTSLKGNDIKKLNLADGPVNLLSKKKKGNYWLEYDTEHKILYFNYNKCREESALPFDQFNNELFTLIDAERPDKIVLDLRYNNGGNSGILTPFIERIKNSYLNRKDSFFVLIGKNTFSSAVMNGVELKKNSNATFIGEETSGSINHYGEVRGFNLPKSDIVIAYSTKYWEVWKGKKGPLKPDIKINYTIENYMEGKDEALMRIWSQRLEDNNKGTIQ
ncbi:MULTISPECIES: hypothetical protein [unclassified Sphingobacterium]|uniref:hypothetical protein n=1 Tax=unclassified Sphingobacterium TaxID=2609468 RepID=UPI0025EA3D40|nr:MULTISPECIES: hypothetical protein [unclassified Sphingobacterium]